MLNGVKEPGQRLNFRDFQAEPPSYSSGFGVYSSVAPTGVLKLNNGWRMFFSVSGPAGGEVAWNITTSAFSPDLENWTMEPGMRIDKDPNPDADYSVNAMFAQVVRIYGGYRAYFAALDMFTTSPYYYFRMRSAVSPDSLNWVVEPHRDLDIVTAEYTRVIVLGIVALKDGSYRAYLCCALAGYFLRSAISSDGINWIMEPGIRFGTIDPTSYIRYFGGVIPLDGEGIRIFYMKGDDTAVTVASAFSSDGLNFTDDAGQRVPDNGVVGQNEFNIPAGAPTVVRVPGGYRVFAGSASGVYGYTGNVIESMLFS